MLKLEPINTRLHRLAGRGGDKLNTNLDPNYAEVVVASRLPRRRGNPKWWPSSLGHARGPPPQPLYKMNQWGPSQQINGAWFTSSGVSCGRVNAIVRKCARDGPAHEHWHYMHSLVAPPELFIDAGVTATHIRTNTSQRSTVLKAAEWKISVFRQIIARLKVIIN